MKTIRFALVQIIPLVFSYVFVGLAFGMVANQAGYSVLWVVVCSAFVYAGSMQIVMISLLSAGAPFFLLAIMTFFVNARYLFYGLGFIDKFRKMGWKYPIMALTITDETYSVLCSMECPEGIDEARASFTIAILCYLLWNVSTLAGAVLGQVLPVDLTGIDFSVTAFFITVCVEQWRKFGSHIPAITGIISAAAFYVVLGPDNFLLPAMSVSLVVLMFMRDSVLKKIDRGGEPNA